MSEVFVVVPLFLVVFVEELPLLFVFEEFPLLLLLLFSSLEPLFSSSLVVLLSSLLLLLSSVTSFSIVKLKESLA